MPDELVRMEQEVAQIRDQVSARQIELSRFQEWTKLFPAKAPEPTTEADEGKDLPLADLVEKCQPSVVLVKTDRGFGTGWVAKGTSFLVTNYHVVRSARRIVLSMRSPGSSSASDVEGATVCAVFLEADLALIRLPAGTTAKGLPLPKEDAARAGDRVFVLGNPGVGGQALEMTVTEGIVSNASRQVNGIRYIQTNAAINPGNSGGPILDMRGQVLGVVTLKVEGVDGIGFAVSSAHVRRLLDSWDSEFRVEGSLIAWEEERGIAAPPDIPLPEGSRVVDVAHRISSIWLEPSGKKLYALDYDANSILVIDVESAEVRSKVFAGSEPASMAASPDGRLLYVACHGSREVVVYDVSAGKATEKFTVPSPPIAVAPTGSRSRFFYIAQKGRPDLLPGELTIHDSGAKNKDVGLWPLGDVSLMSPAGFAWVPSQETLVCVLPPGGAANGVLFLHPCPSQPHPIPPERRSHLWQDGWERWQQGIEDAELVFSPVLVEKSGNTIVMAKRRWGFEKAGLAQKGYFKPAEYPGMDDPDLQRYRAALKVLDQLIALSSDGSLAMSSTNVYDAKTYTVRQPLPFPCAIGALRKDAIIVYDALGKRIVICPMK